MTVYRKEFSFHKLQISLGHKSEATLRRWNVTEFPRASKSTLGKILTDSKKSSCCLCWW